MVLINCKRCNKETNVKNLCFKYCSEKCKKETRLERARQWKINNSEKNKKIIQEWRTNNKEHIYNYNKHYVKNNIETHRIKRNAYQKKKREEDFNFKISCNQRNRLKKFYNGENKTNKYIGCSYNFLIEWFQYLKPELDKNNYGGFSGWQIDHVVPCSLFNFECENKEENYKQCFHWTNLQPLRQKINAGKKNKLTKEEIEWFENKLYTFVKQKKLIIPKYNRLKYVNS
jgi:hypothetical protein